MKSSKPPVPDGHNKHKKNLTNRLLSFQFVFFGILLFEFTSLCLSPVKDFVLWKYAVIPFPVPYKTSKDLIQSDYITVYDGKYNILNEKGKDRIQIEFHVSNMPKYLARYLDYSYDIEHFWSIGNASNLTNSDPLPDEFLTYIETLENMLMNPTDPNSILFMKECDISMKGSSFSGCWPASLSKTASTAKGWLYYMLNELNPHMPGIRYGPKFNFSLDEWIAPSAKDTFTAYFNLDTYGYANPTWGPSTHGGQIVGYLIPAMCNSVEAWLCLSNNNLDSIFSEFVTAAQSGDTQLYPYIKQKMSSDQYYLTKVLLPSFDTTLAKCYEKQTFGERYQWLVTTGNLSAIYPRMSFDMLSSILEKIFILSVPGSIKKSLSFSANSETKPDDSSKKTLFGHYSKTNTIKRAATTYSIVPFPFVEMKRYLFAAWYTWSIYQYYNVNNKYILNKAFSGGLPFSLTVNQEVDTWYYGVVRAGIIKNFKGFSAIEEAPYLAPITVTNLTRRDQRYYVSTWEDFVFGINSIMSYTSTIVRTESVFRAGDASPSFHDLCVSDGCIPILTNVSLVLGMPKTDDSINKKAIYLQQQTTRAGTYSKIADDRNKTLLFLKTLFPELIPLKGFFNTSSSILLIVHNACSLSWIWNKDMIHLFFPNEGGRCTPGREQATFPYPTERIKFVANLTDLANVTLETKKKMLLDEIDLWEKLTNTNVTRAPYQVMSSNLNQNDLEMIYGDLRRVILWMFAPLNYGRGNMPPPATYPYLSNIRPTDYYFQTLTTKEDMQAEFTLLTFTSILTSLIVGASTIIFVVIPLMITILKSPSHTLSSEELKLLLRCDLSSSSYFSISLLPFNLMTGLISLVRLLSYSSLDPSVFNIKDFILIVFTSWRFGIGATSMIANIPLPVRTSWFVSLIVSGIMYILVALDTLNQYETYSRAFILLFPSLAITLAIIFPLIKYNEYYNMTYVSHTGLNFATSYSVLLVDRRSYFFHASKLRKEQNEKVDKMESSRYSSQIRMQEKKLEKVAIPSIIQAAETLCRTKRFSPIQANSEKYSKVDPKQEEITNNNKLNQQQPVRSMDTERNISGKKLQISKDTPIGIL